MADARDDNTQSPTLDLMTGHCSICGTGRGLATTIVKAMHPDAPMVPAFGKPGHPPKCQCRPCVKLAAEGEVPQWFGFCQRCAGLIGAFQFPAGAAP